MREVAPPVLTRPSLQRPRTHQVRSQYPDDVEVDLSHQIAKDERELAEPESQFKIKAMISAPASAPSSAPPVLKRPNLARPLPSYPKQSESAAPLNLTRPALAESDVVLPIGGGAGAVPPITTRPSLARANTVVQAIPTSRSPVTEMPPASSVGPVPAVARPSLSRPPARSGNPGNLLNLEPSLPLPVLTRPSLVRPGISAPALPEISAPPVGSRPSLSRASVPAGGPPDHIGPRPIAVITTRPSLSRSHTVADAPPATRLR